MHDSTPLKIGVLSPLLTSPAWSRVLSGVAVAAAAAGARVVAIQTLDLSLGSLYDLRQPPFDLRAGWAHLPGFVVVADAVGQPFLEELRAAGKQIVLVAPEVEGFDAPVVRADNHPGMRSAVDHLVEHGHRRIAFAGALSQADVRERHAAYREALAAHGLAADPRLHFATAGNTASDGESAGLAMLAAGVPSTAVIAANDLVAVGFARALGGAGLTIPKDQALVGFDDGPAAAALIPALATVRCSPEEGGRRAAALLLDLLAGRAAGSNHQPIPTAFIPRESCGCSAPGPLPPSSAAGDGRATAEKRLGSHLERLILTGTPAEENPAALTAAVDRIVEQARSGDRAPGALREAARLLHTANPRATAIGASVECIRRYHREVGEAWLPEDRTRMEAGVAEFAIELARLRGQRQVLENAALHAAVGRQSQLSIALLRAQAGDLWSLDLLSHTTASAACLGLWAAAPHRAGEEGACLRIAGAHFRDLPGAVPLPKETDIEAFPPAPLLDDLAWRAGEVCAVLPVKVRGAEMGLMAMVTALDGDPIEGRDLNYETTAFLSVFRNASPWRRDCVMTPSTTP
jgi:DNA-binding LacI/PurR family transcriptional regulator